jgi:Ca2+-binding RTX toxin-like protein
VGHTFASLGFHTVRVRAVDKDGAIGPEATLTVPVVSPAGSIFLAGGDLCVFGTAGNDTIRVSPAGAGGVRVVLNGATFGPFFPTGKVKVFAGGGNDTAIVDVGVVPPTEVYGEDGQDTLTGGSGNDRLDGGSGNDSLVGGSGHDTLVGQDGDDRLDGGSGDDVLDGGSGNDTLLSGSGNDALSGGSGNDSLAGDAGNDALDGGSGFADRLDGGSGDDTLADADGVALALGDSGNDLITLVFAPDWTFNGGWTLPSGAIAGESGNDVIRVTGNNSKLDLTLGVTATESGNDRFELYGTWGTIRVFGGSGTDTLKKAGTGAVTTNSIEIFEP